MVLYLTEDIITEAISGQQVIDALNKRTAVLINYADENASHTGKRYIEPYVYGVTKAGNPCIRAYQYWGDTKRGVPKWKLFRLDRIESWEPTEETFELEPQARGWAAQAYNNNGDGSMSSVYKTVELEDEPLSDYEKLKAQNKAIKNRKPVNINNIDLKPTQKSQIKPQQATVTPSGPVGQEQPQQQVQSPIKPQNNVQSEPIQPNGSEDNRQNAPIKQEPKETGPITNNATNPQEHSADELMSNDDFRRMLQRNLDITNQEKERRQQKSKI